MHKRERRIPTTKAREELSATVNVFSELKKPAESIADRAVHVGRYNKSSAVIIPEIDYQAALEREDELENIGITLLLAEREATGDLKGGKPIENLVKEMGFKDLLG